ncbi:SDR family oxidoreductase [Candidatus Microgenomates bacterium]|nr:MAG: SDR family oxidoreductase [Candidatus Microgenomates bacterium]
MKKFINKVAFITGSTRGIGKTIAWELANQGATIILHGSKKTSVAGLTLNEILKISPKSKIYYADLEHFNDISKMAKAVKKDFKQIDILINNAGIVKNQTFLKMKRKEWDHVIKVNLYGTFYVTKLFAPLIKSNGGRIVNISSISGLTGQYGQTNYCASKAGVIGFTKALSKELAKNNITVNAICPGVIDTDILKDMPEKYMNQLIEKISLKRIGKKEEVAKLAAFICSEDANYITGQAISVNGGMY